MYWTDNAFYVGVRKQCVTTVPNKAKLRLTYYNKYKPLTNNGY